MPKSFLITNKRYRPPSTLPSSDQDQPTPLTADGCNIATSLNSAAVIIQRAIAVPDAAAGDVSIDDCLNSGTHRHHDLHSHEQQHLPRHHYQLQRQQQQQQSCLPISYQYQQQQVDQLHAAVMGTSVEHLLRRHLQLTPPTSRERPTSSGYESDSSADEVDVTSSPTPPLSTDDFLSPSRHGTMTPDADKLSPITSPSSTVSTASSALSRLVHDKMLAELYSRRMVLNAAAAAAAAASATAAGGTSPIDSLKFAFLPEMTSLVSPPTPLSPSVFFGGIRNNASATEQTTLSGGQKTQSFPVPLQTQPELVGRHQLPAVDGSLAAAIQRDERLLMPAAAVHRLLQLQHQHQQQLQQQQQQQQQKQQSFSPLSQSDASSDKLHQQSSLGSGSVSPSRDITSTYSVGTTSPVTAAADLPLHACTDCGRAYSTPSNLARHRQSHRVVISAGASETLSSALNGQLPSGQILGAAAAEFAAAAALDCSLQRRRSTTPESTASTSVCSTSAESLSQATTSLPVSAITTTVSSGSNGSGSTSSGPPRKCPHCDKVYASAPAYSMHVRTHSQGCACPQCGKRFSRPWLLQGHLRTHTGEKPFRCTHCGKTFADKSNLRAHVQTHSAEKPHVCGRCGKAFALRSYLYKHEESSCMRSHRLYHNYPYLHHRQHPHLPHHHHHHHHPGLIQPVPVMGPIGGPRQL